MHISRVNDAAPACSYGLLNTVTDLLGLNFLFVSLPPPFKKLYQNHPAFRSCSTGGKGEVREAAVTS